MFIVFIIIATTIIIIIIIACHCFKIGQSLFDEQGKQYVNQISTKAEELGVNLHLPCDFIASDSVENVKSTESVTADSGIPPGMMVRIEWLIQKSSNIVANFGKHLA